MVWSIREILVANPHYAFSEYELAVEYGHSCQDIKAETNRLKQSGDIEVFYRDGLPLYRWKS